jgi:hypothetical protein
LPKKVLPDKLLPNKVLPKKVLPDKLLPNKVLKPAIIRALVVLMLLSAGGCGFIADGPSGWFVTHVKKAVAKGPAEDGHKTGYACIYAAFGMISLGDASIDTAMRNGGIKEVYSVDTENLSIMGAYTQQCTVVLGN